MLSRSTQKTTRLMMMMIMKADFQRRIMLVKEEEEEEEKNDSKPQRMKDNELEDIHHSFIHCNKIETEKKDLLSR